MSTLNPVEATKTAFGGAVLDVIEHRGETTMVVETDKIVEVCTYLRDTDGLEYNFLSDLCAIDYLPDEPYDGKRFAVNYHLYSMLHNRRLRVKVYANSDEPKVPTVTTVWKSAMFQEREAFDMFGIRFEGHPDLRRILMPEDWEGHPQRKDYPLGYEPVQFSFNAEEINRLKPYAKE